MKTVLICDDVQTDRELAGKVVSGCGHHCEYATNGDECITKAKAVKPALILLDVVMPGTDGYSACRTLKKDPATSSIPIVLVTSKGTDADKFWGQKQGADELLAKPFTPDALASLVKRFAG